MSAEPIKNLHSVEFLFHKISLNSLCFKVLSIVESIVVGENKRRKTGNVQFLEGL